MIISDEQIKKVEKILLDGETFNDEQREFIRCNNISLNLVACPGSGKTTALLAKLILLSEEIPFNTNRGICVLTHTNVAINEIKNKLGSQADKLFSYPNFFGTIQSFVDKFLFIPFWTIRYRERPRKIDLESYYLSISKRVFQFGFVTGFDTATIKNKNHYLKVYEDFIFNYRLRYEDKRIIIYNKINGKAVVFNKPNSKLDWSADEKTNLQNWFIRYKLKTHQIDGRFSYEDAYFFASVYLAKFPTIIKSISSRFKYIFIDEMQDTDIYQKEILDHIFPFDSQDYIIQYIGDPNQAIFNNYTDTKLSLWDPNLTNTQTTKFLSNSLRFGEEIAMRIKFVCINNISESLRGNLKVQSQIPHLILYENTTPKERILKKFAELISNFNLRTDKTKPFKAIGSVGKEKEDDKITLKSYFNDYCNKSLFERTNYDNAISYLKKPKIELVNRKGVKIYSEIFFNLIIQILEIGEKKLIKNGWNYQFTKVSLLSYLSENDEEFYTELLVKISELSMLLHSSSDYDKSVLSNLNEFVKEKFVPQMGLDYNKIQNFIENTIINPVFLNLTKHNIYSCPEYPGIEIEITTIHSVKGETHKATLYLDTVFHELDSHHIKNQVLGDVYTFRENKDVRKKRTLKLAHVAMSRPTDLLCFACNKDTFTRDELNQINYENNKAKGWVIKYC